MRPTHIVIHHSLTKDSGTVSWDAIRRYHVDVQGWRDIGYHFGIELVGKRYEIFCGRMLGERGAHCKQVMMNDVSVGVCLIGNFDTRTPPGGQLNLAVKLCRSLMEMFSIPVENVKGHFEFASYKTCPGRMFDMNEFRKQLKGE